MPVEAYKYSEGSEAKVYQTLALALMFAEIGEIVTTPSTKEVYVITPAEMGPMTKVARAFDPDLDWGEINAYSSKVKEKYGKELREKGISGDGSGQEESNNNPGRDQEEFGQQSDETSDPI